ncbi:hypothetical protein RAS1_38580 [Phycisphaerae bacterium RAS1]|nr:hypothetical protein RAS1_38580 [Phycisphaerae bacterium RAS1]
MIPNDTQGVRRGVTLVELVVSMGAMSLLLGAVVSSVVIAGFALPDRGGPAASAVATCDATEQMCADLFAATAFTTRSATAVEFSVADRTGDKAPETLRYAWSGTPGAGLTRVFNGGAAVPVLADVQAWQFLYDTQSYATKETTKSTTTTESLWASFDGWSGITPTLAGHQLTGSSWGAERFTLSLPAGATNIQITRASLKIRAGAGTGSVVAGIHRPSDSGGSATPASAAIGSTAQLSAAAFDASYNWREFTFSDVKLATTDTDLFIVLKGTVSNTAMLQYDYSTSAPADSTEFLWTTSSGGTWQPSGNRRQYDAPLYLYGSYTLTTTSQSDVTRYFVVGVRISGQVGADAASAVETSVHTANMPEVPLP